MKKPVPDNEIIRIDVVSGVEGPSLYFDQYRFAGNKPWGGGHIYHTWKISAGELRASLRRIGILGPLHQKNRRQIRMAIDAAREGEKEG